MRVQFPVAVLANTVKRNCMWVAEYRDVAWTNIVLMEMSL